MNTQMTGSNAAIQGQAKAWTLVAKLGEGDAGEVYFVESLLDQQPGILKRPIRNAFPSDLHRQAAQISREADVLSYLSSLNSPNGVIHLPGLIDRSLAAATPENTFIVISQASGVDLMQMARHAMTHALKSPTESNHQPSGDRIKEVSQAIFLDRIAANQKIPPIVVLRTLSSLINLLERIHTTPGSAPHGDFFGVIWNDVKPEHIFWDPTNSQITLIDWGNARFLDASGSTYDRQHSRLTDYAQLIDTFQRFLANTAPDMLIELAWPDANPTTSVYSDGILPLKERLTAQLEEHTAIIVDLRSRETTLLEISQPGFEQFQELVHIQEQLLDYGEYPDYQFASIFFQRTAKVLSENNKIEELTSVCLEARKNPSINPLKCQILERIADAPLENEARLNTLSAAIQDRWGDAFWMVRAALVEQRMPDWAIELGYDMRHIHFNIPANEPTPFTALNRLLHGLLADLRTLTDKTTAAQEYSLDDHWQEMVDLIQDGLIPRWKQPEPNPPDAGLEYTELDQALRQAGFINQQSLQTLERALVQPRAQTAIIMDAWKTQDFDLARQGLRNVMLWDPDRARLLTADRAIKAAPSWLTSIQAGPGKDEPLLDFVTRHELKGRDLRNQVGSASWLDAALSVLRKLRSGGEPTEVMLEHPEMREYFAWLLSMDTGASILGESLQPVPLERQPFQEKDLLLMHGSKSGEIGRGKDILLEDPLDTWTPEARGSSARVFTSTLRHPTGNIYKTAFKIIRPDKMDYALPLFKEEIQVLTQLQRTPGVVPLIECGLAMLTGDSKLPPEEKGISADHIIGEAIRYGPDSVHNFLTDLPKKVDQGWLPYLAIPIHPKEQNLLYLCDIGHTRGRFLPLLEALRLVIQICDILEVAHSREIVYLDHKILHYYWDETTNGVTLIDWNIARRKPEGLTSADIQFDLVQFGARAAHHIITGRAAPGALPLGPTRPEEIDAAAHSYTPKWTYDDNRLPKGIKSILEELLTGGYEDAQNLRMDFYNEFLKLSELVGS